MYSNKYLFDLIANRNNYDHIYSTYDECSNSMTLKLICKSKINSTGIINLLKMTTLIHNEIATKPLITIVKCCYNGNLVAVKWFLANLQERLSQSAKIYIKSICLQHNQYAILRWLYREGYINKFVEWDVVSCCNRSNNKSLKLIKWIFSFVINVSPPNRTIAIRSCLLLECIAIVKYFHKLGWEFNVANNVPNYPPLSRKWLDSI